MKIPCVALAVALLFASCSSDIGSQSATTVKVAQSSQATAPETTAPTTVPETTAPTTVPETTAPTSGLDAEAARAKMIAITEAQDGLFQVISGCPLVDDMAGLLAEAPSAFLSTVSGLTEPKNFGNDQTGLACSLRRPGDRLGHESEFGFFRVVVDVVANREIPTEGYESVSVVGGALWVKYDDSTPSARAYWVADASDLIIQVDISNENLKSPSGPVDADEFVVFADTVARAVIGHLAAVDPRSVITTAG